MHSIYYAHHQWKYGTTVEQYELDLIKRYFPNDKIFNPCTDVKMDVSLGEEAIMKECLETVRNSDILVFSSMDGVVGTGVFHEVQEARKHGKFIYYIFHNKLYSCFTIEEINEEKQTDRLYGLVDIGMY